MRASFTIEVDREDDGRFIADLVDIPGVMAYGATEEEAVGRVTSLALRVISEHVEERGWQWVHELAGIPGAESPDGFEFRRRQAA